MRARNRRCGPWIAALAAAVWTMAAIAGPADAGRLLVGMTTPLTGPHAAYGQGLQHGVRLALDQINQAGGVDGRPIELQVLDDASDAARAAANARALVNAGAIVLTGLHGARSAEAVRSVLAQTGIPLVGAASSADTLRAPAQRQVFNLRAGASDEVAALTLHLDTLAVERVGVIAQDDALGAAGLENLKVELARLAMRPVAMESVRADLDDGAWRAVLRRLCATSPQGVLLAVDARSALAVLRQAPGLGCASTTFAAFSETGSALAMSGVAAEQVRGLLVTQVLPHPNHPSHPLALAYRRALGERGGASYPSIEGFLYGRVVGETLRRCGRHASPGCVIETLEARPPEIPGWRLRFAPDDRHGSRYVDLSLLGSDGRVRR